MLLAFFVIIIKYTFLINRNKNFIKYIKFSINIYQDLQRLNFIFLKKNVKIYKPL